MQHRLPPCQNVLLIELCKLPDTTARRALVDKIKNGDFATSRKWWAGVLAAELAGCDVPTELVQNAADGHYTLDRASSPKLAEHEIRALEDVKIAREDAMDKRDNVDSFCQPLPLRATKVNNLQ